MIFLTAILMSGVVYSAMNGIQPSLYGEMFPTQGPPLGHGDRDADRLRASAASRPPPPRAIAGDGPNGWVPVAAYVLVSSLIAAIAVATARETHKVPLAVIDGRTEPTTRHRTPAQSELTGAGVS